MRPRLLAILILALLPALTARAESAAVMLERAIHAEETEGDLGRAIDLYRQVIEEAEADRAVAARAWLRLGETHLKLGQKAEAEKAFTAVIEKYSDQADLVARARRHLAAPIDFLPAPWPDHEVMRLELKLQTGQPIGTAIYTVDRITTGGEDLWQLDSLTYVSLNDYQQFTRVLAGAGDFLPRTGRTASNLLGDFSATYSPFAEGQPQQSVHLLTRAAGKETSRTLSVGGPVFDNEQALQLIRRLPLAEGFATDFTIFAVTGGLTTPCSIKVVGREKVTVPAGTFDCFKVDLRVPGMGIQQDYWFNTAPTREFVRMAAHVTMELMPPAAPATGGSTAFKQGIRLFIPAGWFAWEADASAPGDNYSLHLIPPQFASSNGLFALPRTADMTGLDAIVNGDIAKLKSHFKDYTVLETERDLLVAGQPAIRYRATYDDKGRPMVEYRTYLLAPRGVYWFVFRTDADRFDSMRETFDLIVKGLELSGEGVTAAGTTAAPAGGPSAETMMAQGWRLWQQRKLAEAEERFEAAVAADGSLANAWNGLGWARFNQGKPKEAAEAFTRAAELDPKHSAALNGLGWIAKGDGRVDEAIGFWRRAVEALPGAPAAWNGLATTYMERGDRAAAIEAYEQWLKVEPASADAKAGLAKARAMKH